MKVTYDSIPEIVTQILTKVKQIEKLLEDEITLQVKKQRRKPGDRGETLTMGQASQFLGISRTNLYSYVKHNNIPFTKTGGRLFFTRHALDQWTKTEKEKEEKKEAEIQPVTDPDRITVREAVKLFGLPPSRVAHIIKNKKLPAIAKEGNRLYFSKTQLIGAVAEVKEGK